MQRRCTCHLFWRINSGPLGHTKVNLPEKYRWFLAVAIVGMVYLLVGIAFPNPPASDPTQFIWRLAAWAISAVAFVVHAWYEQFRFRNSPRRTALHVSMAVSLGAFGLAVAANIHSFQTATGNHLLLALALVIWPIMTGAPAFVVAFVVAFGLERMQSNDKPKRL